ncbi:MAG: DNA polymerase III subunit gamma/tau [Proteobacteria bacterium]|nr:DNA polymerase III subunit gamma/tau [Pseudomonadota bacterium]
MAKKKSDNDGTEAAAGEPAKPYVVLARKYRPATFDDLIGQSAMVTTLRNAFASGRIAQGYMLTGVRGVGKTTTARILARALNYEAPGYDKPTIDMPGLGVHCKDIMEGRHPDVLEMDAASNTGVDNIREIIESAQYTPLIARTKVFLIDEVHMLSKGAFNALLKTLEEPPSHVRFIFATTEIRKVPVTVLSRCQRFDLRRVEQPVLAEHFQKIVGLEGAQADADALQLIARAAEGSVRDGLSILDQAIAMGEGHVTAAKVRDMLGLADRARIFDLAESLFKGDVATAIRGLESLHRDGAEAAEVVSDLAEAVHAIARVKAVGEEPAGEALTAEEKARISGLASRLSMPYLSRAWQMLVKGFDEVSRAPNPRVAAEMVLIRLAYTSDLPTPDELIKALGGGAVPARRPALPAGEAPAGQRGPLNTRVDVPVAENDQDDLGDLGDAFEFDDGEPMGDAEGDDEALPAVAGGSMRSDPRSFADVVALAGEKRDAKLKWHLEDHVSLVKFDAVAGSIDLFLTPEAPPELANDLREKLNLWTTRRWVVVLSKDAGAPPIGVVRREREAQELESLKAHPAVRAVLEAFPDAKIAEVRRIAGRETDTDSESEAV